MSIMIKQSEDQVSKAITTSEATTARLDISKFSSGTVHIPSGETVVTLTFYSAPNSAGTFLPLYDTAGNAVTLTVVNGRAYQIPAAVFGSAIVKMIGNVACTAHFSFKS